MIQEQRVDQNKLSLIDDRGGTYMEFSLSVLTVSFAFIARESKAQNNFRINSVT